MSLYVVKFGGTSLADKDCIARAASLVKDLKTKGHQIIVVVSAMAGETDRLDALSKSLSSFSNQDMNSFKDVVLSTGEQAASGLFAIALHEIGIKAQPLQGWQIPIITSSDSGSARIESIDPTSLLHFIEQGITPVISGFQGVCAKSKNITTLGRGGSDVTALLIAAAIKADECRLYKDVAGIATADPKLVDTPTILDQIAIEEMFEQSAQGAKIIHPRAIEAALNHSVPLRVLPTFDKRVLPTFDKTKTQKGTLISNCSLEESKITGIVCNQNEVRFVLKGLPSSPGITGPLFQSLADAKIPLDMLTLDYHESTSVTNSTQTLSFTVHKDHSQQTKRLILELEPLLRYQSLDLQKRLAKVSIIGPGVRGHTEITKMVNDTLMVLGIGGFALTATEIKLSLLVANGYAPEFVQLLHTKLGLDAPEPSTHSALKIGPTL